MVIVIVTGMLIMWSGNCTVRSVSTGLKKSAVAVLLIFTKTCSRIFLRYFCRQLKINVFIDEIYYVLTQKSLRL